MATRIKIQDIIKAKGEERKRKLSLFLNGCTERQRCFLVFVSSNPFITDPEDALCYDDLCKVSASCKDEDKFLGYARFTSALRDLWLKYECARQQLKKSLCYFTACRDKVNDAMCAMDACNKALSYIPIEARREAGNVMADSLNKGEAISMESDVYKIEFSYDDANGVIVSSSDVAERNMRDCFDIYAEFVSDVKAYEAVFIELSGCKVVGKDGDAIFIPLLQSFEQMKSKDAFSILDYIPTYEDVPMCKQDYDNVKNNVYEWIGKE